MSCRVIGRKAEEAFLHGLLRFVEKLDVTTVVAEYLPTPKNSQVENFLADQGFKHGKDGRYYWHCSEQKPKSADSLPIEVDIAG